jgi:ATP-binding cassette subfamily B protein
VNTGIIAIITVFLIIGQPVFGLAISTLILIVNYSMQIMGELWNVNNIFKGVNRVFGDAYEMTEILDMEDDVRDMPGAKPLVVKRGAISYDGVSFKHHDAKESIFTDFNLDIKPGERIGLVGISGSGKTTLTKLLLRFADCDQGQISIDGQNIKDVQQVSLRESIAYVPQETSLFHRTIAENIAYAKPDATQAEIERAAKLANAHEFIKDLPNGYETLVGERGIKLSGGQRQRIAIARAILKDAPILVLDEATSALDSESEALIQDALVKLMKGRTSIVVAHRLSTIASLDRIIVLDNGKIVEQGSHAELLKKGGEYNKLWSRQSGAFLDGD